MKNCSTLLLMLLGSITQAQIINFTDANFKARLLLADATNQIAKDKNYNYVIIGTNQDSEINVQEAQAIFPL